MLDKNNKSSSSSSSSITEKHSYGAHWILNATDFDANHTYTFDNNNGDYDDNFDDYDSQLCIHSTLVVKMSLISIIYYYQQCNNNCHEWKHQQFKRYIIFTKLL